MPSVSKNQQKFMGIVRSIQKGEQPASKFSKDAQKAAKKMKKSSVKKYAKTKHGDLPMKKEERDYKDEYKKFQSSTKAKKYRAELNKYNRQKGTYGNGDGKDASHKNGKIVGFESQSKNRGRAEKSRLKKEDIRQEIEEYVDGILDGMGEEFMVNEEKECMCEACQKGYMTHPTRKTKIMFGKRYRNCVKKEGKVDERKFNHKKVGDNYMGGTNTPKGDTEMFSDKKGRYYVWVKPKGGKATYIDLPKNVKDRSKADDLHRKISKMMGKQKSVKLRGKSGMGTISHFGMPESVDEGKYSKIMKAVRKGPKVGPWQIIVSKNNKVVKEVPVRTLQLIPAHYDDIKKAYPNHKIGIEAKDGKIVYKEWVVNIKLKEGSCGYGIDGNLGEEPAGPHLMKKKKKKKDEISLGGRMAKKIGKHRGTRDKGEIAKILKLLVKRGNKKKDAMDMINKNYDRVSKAYRKASPAKKAEILSSLQESVNEAFRPSDRKVLMVIGRDIIQNLNKNYHKGTLTPNKQLGQALNSIFRAMTRDRSDANYQQYKKYFPKYNDKLLKRLSKAYFDQPYNVQNTFIKKVMDYSLKESVNEVSGVDVAKKVLKNKQHEKGIDLQTANLIVTIDKAYNKNPALQKKFRAIQLPKMKQLIMKYYG